MKKSLYLLIGAGVLMSPGIVLAQVANNTTLVGTVTDASGAVLRDVPVAAVNEETKVSYSGTTNGEGYYSIPFVQPGTYDIAVEQAGFAKVTSKGVVVQLNMSARTDVTLSVGSANAEVTVSAATPALSTDDSMIGETLDEAKVANLPIPGRRALDLATTASNVITQSGNPYTGNPPGVAFIGAGTRPVTNSITLDGITVMNSLGSLTPVNPNADALQAVQIQTGNYTAQYGAYMGVHVNMDTKRGTNQIHGTVYEYAQNDYFNAKSFLTRPSAANRNPRTPALRFNQFGGEMGGPIVIPHVYDGRDKLFFMASYEGLRQISQTPAIATVLTPKMRAGDFSELTVRNAQGMVVPQTITNPATNTAYANQQVTNISPVSSKLLAYLPLPNLPGVSNNLNATVPTNVNIDSTLDRVDYNVGEKVRLFGRYYYQKLQTLAGSLVETSNSYSPTTDSNAVVGYTHILTPHLINDFRFGYNKLSTQLLNTFAQTGVQGAGAALGIPGFTSDVTNNNPGIPTVNISNYQGLGSDGTNWIQDDRTLHGYDQISWTKGKHNIMAGAELRKMSIGRAAQNASRGTFSFTGTYSSSAAADFLTGYAVTVGTPITQVKGSVAEWRDGFFVQDNWQITQKLTLLYGLRYELPTVPYSLNGYARIVNRDYTALTPATTATTGPAFTPNPGFKFIGPNHDNWGPRVGFAYRAAEKITVRGGGGIYYNPNHLNSFTLATANYPLANTVTYNAVTSGASKYPALFNFQTPTGTGATVPVNCVPGTVGCYTAVFNDNFYLPTPRMYQWNLDTGTELWRNAGLELQYLGSRAIDLDHSLYPNQPLPVDPRLDARSANLRRLNQRFGQIRQIQNDGFSTYHAFNVALRQRLTRGLDMTLGYTWSHTLDTSADANGGGTLMNQNNIRQDYGNANWDVRNRFVGVVSYAFPELRGQNTALRLAAGGWQANTIVTLQSGQPFNVGISNDQANAGAVGTQRPVLVGGNRETCTRANAINGTSCVQVAGVYTLPALGTYSTMHRNDLTGPGFANTNLSVFKNFPLVERVSLQLRLEAFNVFNHANPGNPNATLGAVAGTTPASSNPTGAALDAGTRLSAFPVNNFGTITTVQNSSQNGGGSRLLQLAGKINF